MRRWYTWISASYTKSEFQNMSLGWLSIGAAGNISLKGLNVDDGTLYVDENGNKVGVRNLHPEASVHVNKARTFSGTYSRTGSTVSVTTSTLHGLVSGDIVRLYFLTGGVTNGRYRVTVTSTSQFTIAHQESGTAAGAVDVTLDIYHIEDKPYTIPSNSNSASIIMNSSEVTRHNLSAGDEVEFSFYSGNGTATGSFISGAFSPPPNTSASANGNYYINTVNGNVFKKSSSNWNYFENLQTDSAGGPYTGANAYFVGSGAPSSGLGSVNDFYVNQDNGEIWRKTGGTWTSIDTVLLSGQTIYSGASDPGNNGDYFMDTNISATLGDIYYKSSGNWNLIGTMRDPTGARGVISTELLTGYGEPGSGLGVLQNLYVNRANGDVHQKFSTGWYLAGNVLNFQPISGKYRITNVSGDSNAIVLTVGWNMIPGASGGVRFRADFSESEREGTNQMVIYHNGYTEPSIDGNVNYSGGLFIGNTVPYAQNRGSSLSLGGVNNLRQQMVFAKLSGVQSSGTNLRSGDMVMETMSEEGPETYVFERMRIKAGGNIGIGTTNPSALLTLDRSTGGNFLLLNGFSYGNGGAGIFFRKETFGANDYNCSIINHDLGDGTADGISINAFGGVSFCTGSNSRLERARIATSGNVGIGTTNPTQNVHLWGNSGTGIKISSSNSTYGSSSLAFHASTTGDGSSDYHAGSITSVGNSSDNESRLDFKIGSGNTLIATMKGNGNVGIGTIVPNSRLHVEPSPTATISDFNLVPTGCIMMWAANFTPAGWLFCRGQEVSRTDYSRLFSVIGILYGPGDGSTTFNVPDLRGRVPLGVNPGGVPDLSSRALTDRGGAETHTLTIAEMPAHNHGYPLSNNVNTGSGFPLPGDDYFQNNLHYTYDTGGSQPHNNMQPFIVLNFIIKH